MKKLLSLLWCLTMLCLLSACSDISSVSASESSSEKSEISETDNNAKSVESSLPSSQKSLLAEAQGPVPNFLDVEQQVLYRKAKTAYMEFALDNDGFGSTGTGEPWLEQDEMQYYKCNGTITKWADFEDSILSVFTSEYYEELNDRASYTDGDGVFHNRTIFMEQNGDLYYSGGARGGNISFVEPETFELKSQSDNEIQFYVIGMYDDFASDKDGNLIEDGKGNYQRAGNPTQEKYLLTMRKGPNGWRFSEFQLAY